MNRYTLISSMLFISFIMFTILGLLQGDISFGIAFFVPFLIGSGLFATIGFLCVFLAVIVYIIGLMRSITPDERVSNDVFNDQSSKKPSIRTGGVILIGPVPIVFGSNWKIIMVMLIVAVFFLLLFFYFFPQFGFNIK